MAGTIEKCANCGRPIGKLETPCVWGENVVCASCHQRLSYSAEVRGPVTRGADRNKPHVNCTRCGYNGAGVRKAKASFWLGLGFLLAGEDLAAAATSGYRISCPRCKTVLAEE